MFIYVSSSLTKDVDQRLFEQHKLKEDCDKFEHFDFGSEQLARKAEKRFLDMGLQGDSGGGGKISTKVYIFLSSDC